MKVCIKVLKSIDRRFNLRHGPNSKKLPDICYIYSLKDDA